MPTPPDGSAKLMIECQLALALTQKEMGELVGRDRRTIQRWQDRGCLLLPAEAEPLITALEPVRPDLATRVRDLVAKQAALTGRPIVVPASSAVVADIVDAVARATALPAPGARDAVIAAFTAASEAGVDVAAVVAGLGRKESGSG